MMALLRCCMLCSAIALSSVCVAETTSLASDSKAITKVLKSQFERPGVSLRVAPISIVDDRAVVGWIQETNGGRALLQKVDGRWEVQVCAGDGLKDEHELMLTGMGKEQAHALAAKVNSAEAGLPKEYLKQLSRFKGSVNMSTSTAEH